MRSKAKGCVKGDSQPLRHTVGFHLRKGSPEEEQV